MSKDKSSISQASSYQEIGAFWDTHDLSDFWDQTEEVEFTVVSETQATYYPVESRLAEKLRALAKRRGVSADTLLNLWIQEKMAEEADTARIVEVERRPLWRR
jgi:hypothetical protein